MENREKVIKGLHYCKSPFLGCKDCPYYRESDSKASCECKLKTDAFKLLKEQEAKTGHWIDTTNIIGFPRCECSVCNSEAGAIWMKYCPNCGAKMEGR